MVGSSHVDKDGRTDVLLLHLPISGLDVPCTTFFRVVRRFGVGLEVAMITPAKEMLSSLLRPGNRKTTTPRVDAALFDSNPNTPEPGPANRQYLEPRHATADFTEADDDEDEESQDENDGRTPRITRPRYDGDSHDGDGRRRSSTMQPLFSASYLGEQWHPSSAIQDEKANENDS